MMEVTLALTICYSIMLTQELLGLARAHDSLLRNHNNLIAGHNNLDNRVRELERLSIWEGVK